MFKINSNILQPVVAAMAKAIKDSGIGERNVYIKNIELGMVSFYFNSPELSAEKRIPAQVEGNFTITISMRELAKKVAGLPSNEEIHFKNVQSKGGNVHYVEMLWGSHGRKSNIFVQTLNELTEFLEVPVLSEKVLWGPNLLSQLVNKFKAFTLKSSSDEAKQSPALSGISMSQSQTGQCTLRAANRRIMVKYISDYQWVKEDVILDTDHLSGVSNLIPTKTEVEVGVSEKSGLVIFQSKDTTCVCRVLSGKYPKADHLFNHEVECKYIFDRSELMELCSRVQKITETGTKMVIFEIRNNIVFAVVPNVLEQQIGASVEGIKWSFAVNAEKLYDCVKFFEAEDEVTLYVQDPNRPITIGCDESPEIQMAISPYSISGLNADLKETINV
ncbi:DNA polymerase III subunit beta [Paenibacillus peoriae]|uniref:DNA polymerase III subunit beta n=1 Tax=Paenibacillus peoriae TaxID=59893 RepID=A0A7H0Y211_9BACL|nr:DNA polymerase III subunit beta [Paenibacillus peoriae]QNR65119.1 DNA polymerase III subunit beta [Paenibacillus peoriae]